MFERFTDRSRKVVKLAQDEARPGAVKAEHVLVGILREGECGAARILLDYGLTVDNVRSLIKPTDPPRGGFGYTPQCQKVFELALREALQCGHNYVAPEHLLLGMIRQGEGPLEIIVARSSRSSADLRQSVFDHLMGRTVISTPTPEPSVADEIIAIRLTADKAQAILDWIKVYGESITADHPMHELRYRIHEGITLMLEEKASRLHALRKMLAEYDVLHGPITEAEMREQLG